MQPVSPENYGPIRHLWQPVAVFFGLASIVPLAFSFALEPSDDPAIISIVLALLVLAAPVAWLSAKLMDEIGWIMVEPEGIRGYNSLGLRSLARWDRIRKVRNLTLMPGMINYLVLDDGRGYFLSVCMPLYIERKTEFYAQVASFAGDDHLLAKALRERGFR
ncbi:MAG: hypothetical protein ACR2HJ_00555 [Fimbriimonadales bacterium]